MKLVGHRGLVPVTLDGLTTALLTADDGTPLAVVAEYLPGRFSVKHCAEPGFRRTLVALGYETYSVEVRPHEGAEG